MSSRHAPPDGTICAAMVSTRLLGAQVKPAALTPRAGHDDSEPDASGVADD